MDPADTSRHDHCAGSDGFLESEDRFGAAFFVSLLASVAATQRIATLGYIAEALDPGERPLGATLGWAGVGSSAT
ncbi:hypothetical protein ACVWYQ_003296 [Bradyrhizobium sp. USDA 3397]